MWVTNETGIDTRWKINDAAHRLIGQKNDAPLRDLARGFNHELKIDKNSKPSLLDVLMGLPRNPAGVSLRIQKLKKWNRH